MRSHSSSSLPPSPPERGPASATAAPPRRASEGEANRAARRSFAAGSISPPAAFIPVVFNPGGGFGLEVDALGAPLKPPPLPPSPEKPCMAASALRFSASMSKPPLFDLVAALSFFACTAGDAFFGLNASPMPPPSPAKPCMFANALRLSASMSKPPPVAAPTCLRCFGWAALALAPLASARAIFCLRRSIADSDAPALEGAGPAPSAASPPPAKPCMLARALRFSASMSNPPPPPLVLGGSLRAEP
mmetsp:Transcript_3673/g.14845  ORF Transcript_3673/g.14845 Transcript_3673/m.14845 type:complete len:247 (-) Transcript_3673:388-1128(-)